LILSEAHTMSAPKPDKIVPYVAYSSPSGAPNGALCVFGDPGSSRMALLCAGFPDDHTVFLPFAKALSEEGKLLVGVMCLPGYDDRPEDGVPWQSHPREGFSFDETARSIQEASKALRGISTHDSPEFIGIFHDWGAFSGTIWAQRLEQEAKDGTTGASVVPKPDKMVLFDVLLAPSPSMPDIIPKSEVGRLTLHQNLCCLYQVVMAITSVIQQYLSRHLAAAFGSFSFILLGVTGLVPTYGFDSKSTGVLYGDRRPTLLRMTSMAYMYRNLSAALWSPQSVLQWNLHEDWKAMPVLYLYGKKKKTQFHDFRSLKMLEREEAEKRSLSKAIGLEGAGHFLYVQKQDECLRHVLEFITTENTFAS